MAKVKIDKGFCDRLAAFLVSTFHLSTIDKSGAEDVGLKNWAELALGNRLATLHGQLPGKGVVTKEGTNIKRFLSESVDWAAAVGKKSSLSPASQSYAKVIQLYGPIVELGISSACFHPDFFQKVGEKLIAPHQGAIEELWQWSVAQGTKDQSAYKERKARAEIEAKEKAEKEAKENEAKPA